LQETELEPVILSRRPSTCLWPSIGN